MDILLITAPALCLAAVIFYFFLRRPVKNDDLHPVIRDLLERAMDQRCIMLVEFNAPELSAGRFFGPCAEFNRQRVLIDASLNNEMPEWIGELVLISFKLETKGASSYYQFPSRLRAMPRRPGGFGLLVDTPEEILPNQKRNFVRLSPPKEATFGLGVWLLKPDMVRPNDPSVLGKALLSYRQGKSEQLSLLNISAGGLRLKIPSAACGEITDALPGERLLCLLMLRSAEGEQTLPFWLDCTIMNRMEPTPLPEEEATVILGLRFDAWAVPVQGKGVVNWFAVGEGGAVGPLASWVLRQQMAQFAQKRNSS